MKGKKRLGLVIAALLLLGLLIVLVGRPRAPTELGAEASPSAAERVAVTPPEQPAAAPDAPAVADTAAPEVAAAPEPEAIVEPLFQNRLWVRRMTFEQAVEAILGELGYDRAAIEALRAEGVVLP